MALGSCLLLRRTMPCVIIIIMNINVEVVKSGTETSGNLIRRFTKRMQGAGIVKKTRKIRYAKRDLSKYTVQKKALKRIKYVNEIERLTKLGRVVEKKKGRR